MTLEETMTEAGQRLAASRPGHRPPRELVEYMTLQRRWAQSRRGFSARGDGVWVMHPHDWRALHAFLSERTPVDPRPARLFGFVLILSASTGEPPFLTHRLTKEARPKTVRIFSADDDTG